MFAHLVQRSLAPNNEDAIDLIVYGYMLKGIALNRTHGLALAILIKEGFDQLELVIELSDAIALMDFFGEEMIVELPTWKSDAKVSPVRGS